MKNMVFRVEGMDCGDEVAVLRKEIGPLVGGDDHLAFDLLQGKMTVSAPDEVGVSEQEILNALGKTGLKAVPWAESCATGTCPMEEGFWQRRGRLLTCVASGILMASQGDCTKSLESEQR